MDQELAAAADTNVTAIEYIREGKLWLTLFISSYFDCKIYISVL